MGKKSRKKADKKLNKWAKTVAQEVPEDATIRDISYMFYVIAGVYGLSHDDIIAAAVNAAMNLPAT